MLSRGAPKLCGEALKTCFNSVVNHCSCPLWVDGTFSGRRYHKTLKTRNWDTAHKLSQELEAAGKPEPAAKTIQDATEAFIRDAEAPACDHRAPTNTNCGSRIRGRHDVSELFVCTRASRLGPGRPLKRFRVFHHRYPEVIEQAFVLCPLFGRVSVVRPFDERTEPFLCNLHALFCTGKELKSFPGGHRCILA